jgi:ankyrin repeat protein
MSDEAWTRASRAVEDLDAAALAEAIQSSAKFDINRAGYRGWSLLNKALDSEVIIHQESGAAGVAATPVSVLLVQSGADPFQRHPEGWTSIDLAIRLRHTRFLDALKRMGLYNQN